MKRYKPAFSREQMCVVDVNDQVECAYYSAGSFELKSEAFFYGVEFFLADGYLEKLNQLAKAEVDKDYQFLGVVYSDMFEYRMVTRNERDSFEGRVSTDDGRERIHYSEGKVLDYELSERFIRVEDYGWIGDDDSNFDEAGYNKAVDELETPFEPNFLLEETLGIGTLDLIDALHRIRKSGTRLWPENLLEKEGVENPEGDPTIPIPPFWHWIVDNADDPDFSL